MIVVTGATGRLGPLIIEELLKSLPADQIGASARDPVKAEALARRGVRVRHGDFARPETLAAAFEDATQVLIVSSNAEAYGGDPLAQHRAAFEAARAAGAGRIVYTSHMAASSTSLFMPMHGHAAAEVMLREGGVPWTALRNGFYASTVPMLVGDAAATGHLDAPPDGPVSWTTHEDLAAAAAVVLTDEGRFDGPTPPLTAAEAFTLDDVAEVLSGTGARPVRRRIISDDELAAGMRAGGLPPVVVDMTLGLYRAARAGEFAATDPTLESLLGRRPATLRDVMTAGARP